MNLALLNDGHMLLLQVFLPIKVVVTRKHSYTRGQFFNAFPKNDTPSIHTFVLLWTTISHSM